MVLLPILNHYSSLTKSEKVIADYIIANPIMAFSLNANELAIETKTSPATVGRFSRKLGFESFVDAKIQMTGMISIQTTRNTQSKSIFIEKNDSYKNCAKKLISQINDVCLSAMDLMDYDGLEKAIAHLLSSENIYIAGIGASSMIAQDLYLKLVRLNKRVHYSLDYHINVLSTMAATAKDVLLLFSYSGESKVIVKSLQNAKKNGVPTIGISGSVNSTLANESDIFLRSPALEQTARVGAVSSHYSQQFVADLIFLGLLTHLYDEADEIISRTENTLDQLR